MKKLHILLAVAALLVAATGAGYAAIPSSIGTISACKDTKGSLKVIDAEAGQTCNANQQLLTWNQEGPAGLQGPAGPAGPAGPIGPEGPIGPSNGYYEAVDSYTVGNDWTPVMSLSLPSGSYVINVSLTAYNNPSATLGDWGVWCRIGSTSEALMSAWVESRELEQLSATTVLKRYGPLYPVTLQCLASTNSFDDPSDASIELHHMSMTAVKVGELTHA